VSNDTLINCVVALALAIQYFSFETYYLIGKVSGTINLPVSRDT